ncbi:hypothetical protein GCM10009584_31050 [Ornithinimicrobium humiphilum]
MLGAEVDEACLEGQRHEEAGEDLGAGLQDAQLLEELDEVAVHPLVARLGPVVVRVRGVLAHGRRFTLAAP